MLRPTIIIESFDSNTTWWSRSTFSRLMRDGRRGTESPLPAASPGSTEDSTSFPRSESTRNESTDNPEIESATISPPTESLAATDASAGIINLSGTPTPSRENNDPVTMHNTKIRIIYR